MPNPPSSTRLTMLERLASAPISWGVCEVPGWGLELKPDRVLREMAEVGMVGTELGSDGYFADTPEELRRICEEAGLQLVGGFVGLVLHDEAEREAMKAAVHHSAELLAGGGATMFVTAGLSTWDWGPRRQLGDAEWSVVADSLHLIEGLLADYGLVQAVHPHVGTIIETAADVTEVLNRSDATWCFDTGHLAIGGYDPLQFLADAGDRIRHVHLKDVHLATAKRVIGGELTLMEGVQAGMFCPMGRGDIPIAEIVAELERTGYDGWYVLEQDVALTEGEPPEGSGPMLQVVESVEMLRSIVD
ncbi:MAG: TIM barrel protein [Actinomycetia bacterium]|nr:TIM barrel protein [Actinomycetes bacterium]MCP4225533.1 TIM barrel protein [Actinomycetes bacterium]MCP5032255.1 TIM barrel protein [Actinomycetes bacterium]